MQLNIDRYKKILFHYSKKKHVKYGAPFLIFVVGGSFAYQQVTNIRYKYRKVTNFKQEVEKIDIKKRSNEELTLENQYEEIKKLDIDNWENKRIPRIWEQDGKDIDDAK